MLIYNNRIKSGIISISDDVCEHIKIVLKNDALTSQGSIAGEYRLSNEINDEKSWVSFSKAIWTSSTKSSWLIGSSSNIGTDTAGVYASKISGSGPDNEELIWHYRNNEWITDSGNDIKVQCIDNAGIMFKNLDSSDINPISHGFLNDIVTWGTIMVEI